MLPAVAPALLGGIHGGIGMAHDVVICAARVAAMPMLTPTVVGSPPKRCGSPTAAISRAARSSSSARSPGLGKHDGEFVTAEPRQERVGAKHALEPLGGPAQQFVADPVAERVVDLLEPVEVEEQQRMCARSRRRSPSKWAPNARRLGRPVSGSRLAM